MGRKGGGTQTGYQGTGVPALQSRMLADKRIALDGDSSIPIEKPTLMRERDEGN